MKDLGKVTYILGIHINRDRVKVIIYLSQWMYIEKMLKWFNMDNSKKGFSPYKHGLYLSEDMDQKTDKKHL